MAAVRANPTVSPPSPPSPPIALPPTASPPYDTYIMSERRYKAHWVQNILHNQKIKFYINNIISEGNAPCNAPELASEVQKLMKTKYGWNEGLIIELIISS
jgi:hypothetical protein